VTRGAFSALLSAAISLSPGGLLADSLPGAPSAAEALFVARAVRDLTARYPTAADAEKAGYLRFTDEDDTGAISYANREWTSSDADHPSQLWYDAKGKLLGADFSVPLAAAPPHLFGMAPARWQTFNFHIHYGLAGPGGTVVFGATGPQKIEAAGGDPAHPTAKDLVTAGIAKSASDVKFVFAFPAIWDLEIWLVPNPDGAFAEKNPNVLPVHPKSMD